MFQETQPLELEFFGGIDSSIPPNDLPPYSAVTARDCVFPQSGVASRSGFSAFVGANLGDVNSIVVVSTKSGSVVARQLLMASRNGSLERYQIDSPTSGGVVTFKFEDDHITVATQYYQRAVLCQSGRSGYGDFARLVGETSYGLLRFSAPAAPTATPAGTGGACTAGPHRFALSVDYIDGSMGPLGEPASATTVLGGKVALSWSNLSLPSGVEVSSISLWATPANAPVEFRRVLTMSPSQTSVDFTLADASLQEFELIGAQPRFRSPRYPALGVEYAGRLCFFGERHKAGGGWASGGSQGTDFGQGPQTGFFAGGVPGGWSLVSGAGHGMRVGIAVIQFDGVTSARARLRNLGAVYNDLAGMASGVSGWTSTFGVRLIWSKNMLATSGSLKYGLTGTVGAADWTIDIGARASDTIYTEEVTVSGSLSSDIKLFFEGIGPGANGGEVYVHALEVFDPTNTSHRGTVWWSEPYQMRTVDTVNGAQTYGTADGEMAWLGFEWQGRFFVAKDSSLWVTVKSDGSPGSWPVEKVSDLIGVCGRRAIGHGPDFKILVNRGGCWLFQGSAVGPDGNVAREIPVEWAAVNWNEAWQIDVAVDDIAQRVYIAVPTGASTFNNALYVLDYSSGFGPGGPNGGRRWAVWPIEARGICVNRRKDATSSELWISRGVTPSASYVGFLDPAATADWGNTALSYCYETGKAGAGDGALGLFRKLAYVAVGSGLLVPSLVKSDGRLVTLPAQTLYRPSRGTQHVLCNVKDERVGIRLELSGAGASVHLHRAALWMRRNPFGPYRVETP